jgi:hypothetical protein
MEGTDLKNGATEPTKATDPRSTAQNSTRAKRARVELESRSESGSVLFVGSVAPFLNP